MRQLSHPETAHWNATTRVAFRIAFLYFGVHAIPELLHYIPVAKQLYAPWSALQTAVGDWIIAHVLHLPASSATTWGEPLQPFLFDLLLLMIAVIGGAVWSMADRPRTHYVHLYAWLHALVRFALAAVMFEYAWGKLLPIQFGDGIRIYMLPESIGNVAPPSLLWTFMGASRFYAFFGGAVEMAGALLLCFRRTTTLGALILVGAISNVVALNVAYDVNVKVYASNLLLMAIFVAARDARRLWQVFFLQRPGDPTPLAPLFASARWNRVARLASPLMTALLLYQTVAWMVPLYQRSRAFRAGPKPAIHGLFDVEEFTRTGSATAAEADSTRWTRFAQPDWAAAWIHLASGSDAVYRATIDEPRSTAFLTLPGQSEPHITFAYQTLDPDRVLLRGTLSGDSIVVRLRRVDLSSFRLVNHRRRWQW